ncbi:cilia- and flagella-associated protein 251-like [Macrobrachium nipponense]|uniref:cilia- and flagella-associated protein 251-like n=1 Tax=Macrobrachium nipponense TaxID=159736 RepID=UPI0030C7FB80
MFNSLLSNKKQETDSDDEEQEFDRSSMDSSLDQTEETEEENLKLTEKTSEPDNAIKLEAIEKLIEENAHFKKKEEEMETKFDLLYYKYEGLQKIKEKEKELANKTITDLKEMNERHRNTTNEMEESNRLMKAELERAKEENRAQMERQSQLLKEKEELEKDIKEQAHIIAEMSEENGRLQKELMEAKMNDFVRGERHEALLTELDGLKEKISFLENKLSKPVEEEENEASEEDLPEESVPLPQQVSHLGNDEETLENQGRPAKRKVTLNRNLLQGKLQAKEEQKVVDKDAHRMTRGAKSPNRLKRLIENGSPSTWNQISLSQTKVSSRVLQDFPLNRRTTV